MQVVAGRVFVGRVLVLADVDPEQATLALRTLDIAHERVDAAVVEAEPVDHRFVAGQAEHARLRVAGLRPRGHGADLDETEAQRQQCVDVLAVLVHAGGHTDRVGKGQSEQLGRQRRTRAGQQADAAGVERKVDRLEADPVGAFGVQAEQERAGEGVHRRRTPQALRATSQGEAAHNANTTKSAISASAIDTQPSTSPATAEAVAVELAVALADGAAGHVPGDDRHDRAEEGQHGPAEDARNQAGDGKGTGLADLVQGGHSVGGGGR